MKLKQNISTLLYLLVSACLLSRVLFLGSSYIKDNVADVADKESSVPEEDPVGTDEIIGKQGPLTDETNADTKPADETDSDETIAVETVYIPDETETMDSLDFLIEKLYTLFEEAPYRWEKYDEADLSRIVTDETTAETETDTESESETETESESETETEAETPEYVEIYPKLAYFYKDLSTGKIISYNADEILYSASLIKAPYVYAVMEEIDNFVRLKLPEEYETEESTDESLEESETEKIGETSEETAEEAETEPVESEPVESESTESDLVETEESAPETEPVSLWDRIEYTQWDSKYNLGETWTYDPENMHVEGSGEIIKKTEEVQLTWFELFEYALLYSDNVAFDQIRQRFGYGAFYRKVGELGIQGTETGFMNLSANDCGIFLEAMYEFFESNSFLAEHMRDTMAASKTVNLIAAHYPTGTAAHKYGWDLNAFHDMAVIYDKNPYIIVIMTDYEDGGRTPTEFFADVVALTKEIHAEIHRNDPITDETESGETSENSERSETDDIETE